MKTLPNFSGFPKEALTFYSDLRKNNNRTWFHTHHDEFEQFVMTPARAFVVEMGLRLATISPYIYAEPKVNRSIFRIARDARRHKNELPYKTSLALFFWETALPRMEAPGFYLGISPEILEIGVGLYRFSKPVLAAYREAVVDKNQGKELITLTKEIEKKGYTLSGERYKRIPSGYNSTSENESFLKHDGLFVFTEIKPPRELHSAAFLDFVFAQYREMARLHRWLVQVASQSK